MTLPSRGTQNVAIVNSLAEGERWYVAGTLANREFSAALQLEAQRFHVFLPYVNKSVRHARRTRQVKRAAFPGYMFVALDPRRDRCSPRITGPCRCWQRAGNWRSWV